MAGTNREKFSKKTNRANRKIGVGSLSGQGKSTRPAILWAVICAGVWILAWLAGHRWHRWLAYLIATPIFLFALFVFFENFSRFVPADI